MYQSCLQRLAPLPLATSRSCVRRVAGVRRLLGGFIRAVHPDLTEAFPSEARRVNQSSLSELNAFVDLLEGEGPRKFEEGPEVSCELPFFRALRTRLGREVPNRVVPLQLVLPSLPAAAEEEHKELAAAQLLRGAELALEEGLFSERPEVPSLFSQPGASRAAFDKLWWQQTQEELVREAIHGPDDEKVKLHMAKRVFACKYAHQLMRRFLRIKNTKKRKLRIAQLDELVQSKVAEKFQGTERAAPTKHGLDEREDPVRVLQGGFHPDLVFLKPGLAENQRREAIRRVCGMNLASDADFWLLENLWKAMRSVPPPVPIVIAESEYRAHGSGFIQLPFDFTVPRLCDFLEEHLDAARAALVSRKAIRGVGDAWEEAEEWVESKVGAAIGITTEPYMKWKVGQQVWMPDFKSKQSYSFAIYDPEQHVHVSLWDRDLLSQDDLLGEVVPVPAVQAIHNSGLEVPFTHPGNKHRQIGAFKAQIEFLVAGGEDSQHGFLMVLRVREIEQAGSAIKGKRLAVRASYKGQSEITKAGAPMLDITETIPAKAMLKKIQENMEAAGVADEKIGKVLDLTSLQNSRMAINRSIHFVVMPEDSLLEELTLSLVDLEVLDQLKKKEAKQSNNETPDSPKESDDANGVIATQTILMSDLKKKPGLAIPGPFQFESDWGTINVKMHLHLSGLETTSAETLEAIQGTAEGVTEVAELLGM
ncbi:unnamed protein product [Effrenium voratum]|nr:unnamed protein product [Effrenium voratum]